MIPLDRVRRQLRSLDSISEHELANSFEIVVAALLDRAMDEAAEAVHEAVTRLRGIAARKIQEARRTA